MSDIKYKKLLAEVLGRVDERDIKIDVSDFPKSVDKVKDDEDFHKLFVAPGKKDPATFANLGNLADETATSDTLTDTDIVAALKKGNDTSEYKLVKHMQRFGKKDVRDRISKIENQLFTDGELDAGQLRASDTVSDEDATQTASAAASFAVPDMGDVQSSQTSDGVFTDFSSFIATAPKSVIDQFQAIEGTGLRSKFEALQKFGVALKGEKAAVDVWVKENSAFKFMNYAPAYLSLVDMAKKLSGNEAGYAFEKYLALLLSSPVVGGSNGAADNIGKISGGRKVFMSAKMLDFRSANSISQAIKPGESDGIEGVVKVKGEPIFYLSILKGTSKTTGTTGFNKIRLYLHKVYWDPKEKEYRVSLLDEAGNAKDDYKATLKYKLDKDKKPIAEDRIFIFKNQHTPSVLEGGKLETFTLPAPVIKIDKVEQLVRSTSEYVAQLADSLADTMINELRSIYENLELMKKNTRSFIAQKSSDAEGGMDYVEKISNLYKNTYSSYKNATEGESQHIFGDEKVSKAMGLPEIKELTKNILKEILLDDE